MQLTVGRVSRPHGIRGEVFVQVHTDDPADRFAPGTSLRTDPAELGPLTVRTAAPHGRGWRIGFTGFADRSAAEGLRGTALVVDSADLPPTADPGDFHDSDLIGLAVKDTGGVALGEVRDVLHGAGGSMLVVALGPGGTGQDPAGAGREVLVPFVHAIVPIVDLDGGRLVLDPPPGLFEL